MESPTRGAPRSLLSNPGFPAGGWRRRLLAGPGDVRSEAPVLEGASRPRWMAKAVETSLIDTPGPLNPSSGQHPPCAVLVQTHGNQPVPWRSARRSSVPRSAATAVAGDELGVARAPARGCRLASWGWTRRALPSLAAAWAGGVGLRLWWRPGRTVHYTELSRDGA